MGIFSKLYRKNKRGEESASISKVANETYVTCASCQRKTQIKIFEKKQIAILGPDAIESFEKRNIAMKCQGCGAYLCFSCVSSTVDPTVGIPKCPKCGKEGGPSFIVD